MSLRRKLVRVIMDLYHCSHLRVINHSAKFSKLFFFICWLRDFDNLDRLKCDRLQDIILHFISGRFILSWHVSHISCQELWGIDVVVPCGKSSLGHHLLTIHHLPFLITCVSISLFRNTGGECGCSPHCEYPVGHPPTLQFHNLSFHHYHGRLHISPVRNYWRDDCCSALWESSCEDAPTLQFLICPFPSLSCRLTFSVKNYWRRLMVSSPGDIILGTHYIYNFHQSAFPSLSWRLNIFFQDYWRDWLLSSPVGHSVRHHLHYHFLIVRFHHLLAFTISCSGTTEEMMLSRLGDIICGTCLH